MKLLSIAVLAGSFLFSTLLYAADPVISEFLASNSGPLRDEDGDSSDWIEIYNSGPGAVELAGWRLTDDAENLLQWTFPATNLPPGRFLLVFASGKNRAVAGAPLHTSFQLDSAGEYLALVRPDGTVAHQFAPLFPPQVSGISYGAGLSATTTRLVTNGASARWIVPLSAVDYPSDWTSTNFIDVAWNSGRTGLGFDAGGSNIVVVGTATNVALGKPATQSSTLGSFTASLAVNGNTSDFTHTAAGQGLPATWEVSLGTNHGIDHVVLLNRGDGCCGSRLRDITVRILSADGTATNFTSALLNPENTLGGGTLNGPANLSLNLTQLTGGLVIGGRVRVTRTPDPDRSGSGGQGNADEADVLSLGEVQVFGLPAAGSFNSLVRTDLTTDMRNVNATALLRLPFFVDAEELPPLDQFTLRLNYDDGFAAFLNGVKIAEANAPVSLDWNSAATAEHPDALAFQAESFDLSSHAGLLQNGLNVLAIQALNFTAADDDFLVVPELTGVSVDGLDERYFTQPTPGTLNTPGTLGLVADTKFSVDRGFFDVPFTVAITTATAGAEIRFTTNGSAPSATSGTLYTGPILISRTTVLRAIATKPGWTPSNVDTHTYVFLDGIVAQSHQSVTNVGYPNTWVGQGSSVAADYSMDPRITVSNAMRMIPSLRSLPSMFISTSISNLFGPTHGIYSWPESHGVAWERPASIEMVDTNGATEFQEDAGLRIQGGYFRQAAVTQKHSLRVLFKGIYGAGKLRHDLFRREDAVTEFDGFVLRAGANDGYAWNAAKDTEQFTRDQFGRELHIDMGHSSPHGLFVHLYLNGVYWGLYNLVERANEDFSASYYGGEPEDWDANNAGDYKSGDLTAWNNLTSQAATATTVAAYQRLQGNHPDGSRNPAFPVLLDRLNYIDYMIANIWGGNWDWPNKNFWFGRLRTTNSTGFKFYMWDFENTMGNDRGRSPVNMVSPRAGIENEWVGQPHNMLKSRGEYRIDFADRVQRYFFSGGLLTPEVLTNRYRALADHVELSIYAETARWGDDNLSPPQDIDDWRREREWILGTYLPQRSAVVLQQFRAAGLYPNVAAPGFSQLGGEVPDGYNLVLSHTNVSGAIYFTLDGGDPRLVGGAVNPAAQSYAVPITINAPTLVRARVLTGTNWSAVVEAILHPPQDLRRLLVTEIMYGPPDDGLVDGDEFEFLEFKNTGPRTLNLGGLRLVAGITFTFTNGTTLGPGEFFVLARNPARFAQKYPGVPVRGAYLGRLDNAGESLRLAQFLGSTLLSVTYEDRAPWPVSPDGHGFSLVPVDPNANLAPDDARSWRSSSAVGGSPGADDPAPMVPGIWINEAFTASVLPARDAIELFNPSAGDVNVGGWFLTDEPDTPRKFRIPDGTILGAGGFALFDETRFNPTPGLSNSFSLRAEGDDLYLFSADAAGQLTGYSHGFSFGAAERGVTFGRHRLSTGEDDFTAQVVGSLGGTNVGPKIGPVVINEIHYHPDAGGDEFIEIRNLTGEAIALFDPDASTNTWRLDGLGFDFPPGLTLESNGLLLIVPTDPAAFRLKYAVAPEVTILGPYAGQLQDSGERLELQKPGPPDTNGAAAHITVDAVRYNDKAPWPPAADGSGPSLQRKSGFAYGNDPIHWEGALPTPGRNFLGGPTPVITAQPVSVAVVATREAQFSVAATGPEPIFYQWRRNGAPLANANSSTLLLTNLRFTDAGHYTVLVFNENGSVESDLATLTVLVPANILTQPTNRLVKIRPDTGAAPQTNVSFIVVATSTTPIRYQWRFQGAALPGATNAILTVTNVQLSHEGVYDAALTDAAGTIYSAAVVLQPLISPVIVRQPASQTVAAGSPVTLSVAVSGHPKPFTYEWRRGSLIVQTNVTAATNSFYTFTTPNVSTQTYRVVIKNLANLTGIVSANATLITLLDSDQDGLPDAWETSHGFATNNLADAALDADGDGLSNRQEYEAGTDPTDASSYLKIDAVTYHHGATITFGVVSNKTYAVQFTETPGAGTWSTLIDLAARTNHAAETVFDPAFTPARAYRLVTPRQP